MTEWGGSAFPRAVAASRVAALTVEDQAGGGEHLPAGGGVEVARLACLERSEMGGEDERPKRVVVGQSVGRGFGE